MFYVNWSEYIVDLLSYSESVLSDNFIGSSCMRPFHHETDSYNSSIFLTDYFIIINYYLHAVNIHELA